MYHSKFFIIAHQLSYRMQNQNTTPHSMEHEMRRIKHEQKIKTKKEILKLLLLTTSRGGSMSIYTHKTALYLMQAWCNG